MKKFKEILIGRPKAMGMRHGFKEATSTLQFINCMKWTLDLEERAWNSE